MSDGYLSRDRAHLAELQRQRRAGMVRIDYMPAADALAAIEGKRAQQRPGSVAATNSAVIDAIVREWAALTGINKQAENGSRTGVSAGIAPAPARESVRTATGIAPPVRAHANDSDAIPNVPRAGANDSGTAPFPYRAGMCARTTPAGVLSGQCAQVRANKSGRVPCGARRRRDGQPCEALSVPGKRRCKWHGGCSTGPRTPEGKARALANLRQYRTR